MAKEDGLGQFITLSHRQSSSATSDEALILPVEVSDGREGNFLR